MLRYRTELAWFSHLVRHPARKWSRSILSTPELARGGGTREQFWLAALSATTNDIWVPAEVEPRVTGCNTSL